MPKPKLRVLLAIAILGLTTVSATAAASPDVQADNGNGRQRLIRPVVATDADWAPVATAIGRTGKLAPGGTAYRVNFPRRDLTVTSGGVTILPALSLGGYASFATYPDRHAMVMGDLVVTEAEAPAVTDALQAGGLAVAAIHKHLLAENPPLWWIHVAGMGTAVGLARAVKAAVDKTATPPPVPAGPPGTVALNTAGIDAALGGKGSINGGVYQFTFARRDTITEGRYVVPPGLGVTTPLNFQPLGGGRAAINGDFAMTAGEVQGVLATLRGAGISVVSLHNHALDDSPRLFYTHFWATGDGVALAQGLRAALDQTAVKR